MVTTQPEVRGIAQ